MDEYYYQRLLNDPKTFSATESVQNLEGWTFDVLPLPLLDEIESNKVQNGHNGAEPKRVEITGDKLERWWLQDVCGSVCPAFMLTAKTGTRNYVSQTAIRTPIYPQGFVSHKICLFRPLEC